MTGLVDEHCDLSDGKLFEDFHCVLTQVDEEKNIDKFYLIQMLTDADGYYVWTRWGRNGTTGQSKLDGPTERSEAVKNFKKKIMDKTKNKWEKRNNFVPTKGKYTMVNQEASQSSVVQVDQSTDSILASLEEEKPVLPDTVVSGKTLHADVLYHIMFFLSTKHVLRCMQVCKFWKMVLSQRYFWKMLIYRQFDLALKSDVKNEDPLGRWADPKDWFCYFDDESDPYVFRPFPSMWKCGVVHPFGLEPMSGDVKSLQGFCRSLEIVTYMRKGAKTFGIASGNECSGSEGCDDICVVLFPWDEDELPNATTIITQIFHFHPEVAEEYINDSDQGERRDEMLYYHLPGDDYEEDEHDIEEKPCLNRIFGFGSYGQSESNNRDAAEKFYAWLQKIMVPTIIVYAGSDKFNPVVVFFLTKLAPGWVGGALTAVTWT